jgi:hypothetical protein
MLTLLPKGRLPRIVLLVGLVSAFAAPYAFWRYSRDTSLAPFFVSCFAGCHDYIWDPEHKDAAWSLFAGVTCCVIAIGSVIVCAIARRSPRSQLTTR